MFSNKNIKSFIKDGFRKVNKEKDVFDSEYKNVSNRISAGKKIMEEKSKNRKLIQNK
ncbi:hypothetical protein P4H66_19355 [Paenibacillus dokdonensis]|uniref:Uncharacterized protein n=1 Tax=Paenibacillus dokdonensis TaxID=2567944 RepID=A0ABU6GRE5_9BACL|nr:hypothetical protein [Paenibacillus dokdonensis]MEC0241963.1 hypothetical protein [Paenibacillus dokdonensis]